MEEQVTGSQGLSDEDRQKAVEYARDHPFGDQDENGIDLSLLRANLRLSPTERIEKMRQALRLVLEIELDRPGPDTSGFV